MNDEDGLVQAETIPKEKTVKGRSWVKRSVKNWEKARKVQLIYRCLIFARNSVYNKMLSEQYLEIQEKKIGEISTKPTKFTTFKFYYELVVCFINYYLAFTIPFRLAFFKNHRVDKLYIHDLILDAILFLGLVFKVTSERQKESYLYNATKYKYIQYFMSITLYTDLLSVIPLYMLSNRLYWLKIGRIIRVNSIFYWFYTSNIPKFLLEKMNSSMYGTLLTILNVIKLGNYILIICHCIACLWYIIPNELSTPNNLTWLGEGWQDYSIADNYMRSLYWTAVTFSSVGYGDITGKTLEEYIYSMFVEFLGIMCFAYFMGSLTNSLSEYMSKKERINYRENELNKWAIWVEQQIVDPKIQDSINEKIINYFSHKWLCDPNSLNHEEDYLMMLPPSLAEKLNKSLFGQKISLFRPFFRVFPKDVRYIISGKLLAENFPPKIELIKRGSKNSKIYFINAGSVAVGDKNIGYALMLDSGSFFGEDSAIFEDFSLSSFVTRKEVCVNYIEFRDLKKIMLKKKIDVIPIAKLAFKRAKYFEKVNDFKYKKGEYVNDEEIKEFCSRFNLLNEFDFEDEDEFWERGQELKNFSGKKPNKNEVMDKKIVDEVRKQSEKLGNEVKKIQKIYENELRRVIESMTKAKENSL